MRWVGQAERVPISSNICVSRLSFSGLAFVKSYVCNILRKSSSFLRCDTRFNNASLERTDAVEALEATLCVFSDRDMVSK